MSAASEAERLRALASYGVMDTPAERDFDDLVDLAARVCEAPIALVSLVDERRQWFKARHGVELSETPREVAFCAHAIAAPDDLLVVPDATRDERFADNPLVVGAPGVRFYAGAPLVDDGGAALGTLCVMDRRARELTPSQGEVLRALARQAIRLLELRRAATALARAEERLRHDSQLLRLIIDQSGEGVIVCDADGVLRMFNREAERQHGVALREVGVSEWAPTYGLRRLDGAPLAIDETPLARALRGASVDDARWRVRRPDGSERTLEGSARPLYTAEGAPAGAVLLTRDVTERERAEAAAASTAAFRERSMGILGHDLRNPLSAIAFAADLLLERGDLGEADRRHAERIARSAERMGLMVSQLLDFTRSRLGGGLELDRSEVSLGDVVRHAVEELSVAHPGRELRFVPEAEIVGRWDAARLAQVVSNLVANAIEHSPPDTPVRVTMRDDGGVAEVAVSNAGAAIPPALRDALFEPFRRGDTQRAGSRGLGLGLYIVREIVEAHGGAITVTSTEGEGTTFTVRLPRR